MSRVLHVLVACEESQAVTKAFRALGHNAFSCDIQECSGGHPEWHIQGDAVEALYSRKWDLVIAHPPCTRLCNSGVMWLERNGLWQDLNDAIAFFNVFTKYGKAGNFIAIENPIPHKYAVAKIGKYSQVIQPYHFGHKERKATCLWLYGLPKLNPANNVFAAMQLLPKREQQRVHYLPPSADRAKLRSKTYTGIAEAMATQWSAHVCRMMDAAEQGITAKESNLLTLEFIS